jgi:hypothetical protein
MAELVDIQFRATEKIRVVLESLRSQRPAAFCQSSRRPEGGVLWGEANFI